MYHTRYAEILDDASSEARAHERRALDHAIELLTEADKQGRRSREATEALLFVSRLWSVFLEDLASPENGLPDALRADLVSIGIWVLKEVDRIQRDESDDFVGLIEICKTIRGGLK